MDGESQIDSASPGIKKTLALVEGLRAHPAGSLIYQQVEQVLLDHFRETLDTECAYAALLSAVLDTLADQVNAHDPLRLQVRLLQRRLQPPLTRSELASLQRHMDGWKARLRDLGEKGNQSLKEALMPLLADFGLSEAPTTPAKASRLAPKPAPSPSAPATPSAAETPPSHPGPEQKVNALYRTHLDEKNREVQELETALADQIQETIRQHQEVGASLEVALSELRGQVDADEVSQSKDLILQVAQDLLNGNQELTNRLDTTYQTLQQISVGSRRLSDELSRVRQLSLTDELTDLPNRRAFQRRLEDEIARANRYRYPLTLSLLDLDEFKSVNDTYGHAAGDEILKHYASEVLSIFRRLDMVARYGGEEFAVLLPNTDLQGAIRALHKIKARVPEVRVDFNGEVLKLPTFSAGVASYQPGETAESYISRTDAALYEAKRLGRNRFEVSREDRGAGAVEAGAATE